MRCPSNNEEEAAAAISSTEPDVALFDRFILEEQFGHAVERVAPTAVRVVDTQDFHSLRLGRHEIVKGGNCEEDVSASADFVPPPSPQLSRELASILRSDLSIMCSTQEMLLLSDHYRIPSSTLALGSFLYPPSVMSEVPKRKWSERRHFVSLGNFRHKPNR